MYRRVQITILFSALFISCNAQISFGSSAVENLFKRTPERDKVIITKLSYLSEDHLLDTIINLSNKHVCVSFNDFELNNIGIDLKGLLFSNKNDSMVIAFIKRALYRLSLENTLPDVVNEANIMQMRIFYGNNNLLFSPIEDFNEVLDSISVSSHFTLFKNKDIIGTEWKNENFIIRMLFPNNFQLIVGKNKKELDEEFFNMIQKLVKYDSFESNSQLISNQTDSFPIIIKKGKSYYNLLTSDTYFKFDGKDCVLIFDRKLIGESIKNLFLNKKLAGERILIIDQKLYGGRYSETKLPLFNFLNYFENDFTLFVGLEKEKPELLEGTLILSHLYFNYIHLLHFKTDFNQMFDNSGIIEAKLYTNIPMHNVSNIYEQNDTTKFEKQINLNIKIP